MNIHEAITELKNGNPIYRKSDRNVEIYFLMTNIATGLTSYVSYSQDDLNSGEFYSGFHKTERFSIEEIEATDWHIYSKDCSATQVPQIL